MITDRTATDVAIANTLRQKIQSGETLTSSEITAFERGSCTIIMLNRIEDKQAELAGLLNNYSYMVHIVNKTWTNADIFENADYLRLLNNDTKLKQAFYTYQDTPETPTYMYGYEEANASEKILVDIENMITDMLGRFRQCGTFSCGEENEN